MNPTNDEHLRAQVGRLKRRLQDAEQTLGAIRRGEVDALVIETPGGKRVYTLHGADEPYRLMIERMHEGAATLTPHGMILYCNQHLAELLHRPMQHVIGSNLKAYLGEQAPQFMQMLDAVHDADQRQEFELRCCGDHCVHVQLSLSLMTIDEQVRVCAVFSDLTEHRQLEQARQSEAHFRQLAQAVPHIVWRAGPDGQADFLNDRWGQYTGLSVMTSRERGWLQGIHPDDQARIMRQWHQAYTSGEPFEAEFRLRRHDGIYRWHLTRGTPIRDEQGQIQKWVGATTDIDTQKQAATSLKNIATTLEQRVDERTALAEQRAEQLRYAASQLAQAEQRERRRIAHTLHDHLQQILVAARFKVSMSRKGIGQSSTSQASLDDIDKLLHDAIEASRNLSTDLSPPILHERGLADALHWLARRVSKQHGLAVDVQIKANSDQEQSLPPALRDFLFHSTRELLFNAVKHAHCSRALLTVNWVDTGEIELTVADDGMGCDPAQMMQTRDDSGGIGLSSVRYQTELWGGTMQIDSAPGQGCRLTMRLPLPLPGGGQSIGVQAAACEASQPWVSDQPAMSRTLGNTRVLIADDHVILRDGLAGLLRQHGFDVVAEADDGRQAIELARDLQPDVILMDVSMPHVNGIDATRLIHAQAPDIRIIGLSMHDDVNIASTMRQAGAVAFLTKGSPSELLIDTIRNSLAQQPMPSSTPGTPP